MKIVICLSDNRHEVRLNGEIIKPNKNYVVEKSTEVVDMINKGLVKYLKGHASYKVTHTVKKVKDLEKKDKETDRPTRRARTNRSRQSPKK